jgi:drug/metabolite transporter (DMT)-like permease
MSLLNTAVALACVLAICIGQLLFKRVSIEIQAAETWLDAGVFLYAAAAFAIYAGATLLWIHVLRAVDLSRAYPLMALSFVIVPIASSWLYGDRLSSVYFVGVILICAGVVVISRAS